MPREKITTPREILEKFRRFGTHLKGERIDINQAILDLDAYYEELHQTEIRKWVNERNKYLKMASELEERSKKYREMLEKIYALGENPAEKDWIEIAWKAMKIAKEALREE